jgi:peptidoglycan/LPS O-acetylase OafA/YrhL
LLSWRPLPFLGKISFGLYVYHALSLKLSGMLAVGGLSSYAGQTSMALAICIAISAASYLLYEKRFLQLKARFETVRSRPP